jgi:pimeloyl-[acyl-carrier protein] synthase
MDGITIARHGQHEQVGTWNPFHPASKKDPNAYLHSLRGIPDLRTISGHRIFLDYYTVKLLLNHPLAEVFDLSRRLDEKGAFANTQERDFSGLARKTKQWLVHANPPGHTELRELLTGAWHQQEFTKAVEDFIASLIPRIPLGEPFDWIPFAEEMPIYVIGKVLGIPTNDRRQLRYWSKLMTLVQEPFASMYDLAQVDKGFDQFEAYLTSFIGERISAPSTRDLTGRLCLALSKKKMPWSSQDIVSFLSQVFMASIETSTIFLGQSFAAVAGAPAIWEKVCGEPGLVPLLTEDLLRLISPLLYTGRKITAPITLANGITLQEGEVVFLSLCGANRDPGIFGVPDQLSLRQPNGHLSFGFGSHYCFGSRIARFEFNSLFKALANRKWQWELAHQELEYQKGISFRELKKLIIHVKECR